jgi:phosphoenolpyruvate carboxylase
MKLTSQELQQAQNVLQQLAKNEIDAPMTNHAKLARLIKVADEIDTLRREVWNEEKFGASDRAADEAMKIINSDDIPF